MYYERLVQYTMLISSSLRAGDGLIMRHGLSHVRKRKLLTPAFHFDVLRDYVHVFHRSAHVLLVRFLLPVPSSNRYST